MSELSETGRQIVRELGGDPDRDTPDYDKLVEESIRNASKQAELERLVGAVWAAERLKSELEEVSDS